MLKPEPSISDSRTARPSSRSNDFLPRSNRDRRHDVLPDCLPHRWCRRMRRLSHVILTLEEIRALPETTLVTGFEPLARVCDRSRGWATDKRFKDVEPSRIVG